MDEAVDGLGAIEAAKSATYDVILMDIRMPGLCGPEAAARIRCEEGPNQETPILAFSADIDLTEFEASGSDFNGMVRKPLEMQALMTALSRHQAAPTPDTSAAPGRQAQATF